MPRQHQSGDARTRVEHYRSIHDTVGVDFGAVVTALEQELAQHIERTRAARSFRSGALAQGVEVAVAVLVGVYHLPTRKDAQDRMDELKELARTAGVRVVDEVVQYRRLTNGDGDAASFVNDPRYVVGKGRLEEICLSALHQGAEMVIFDGELTPSQMNAITDVTDLKIVDRTMLILDIFARRAKSREGRMQVELAQLRYSVPRLAKKQEGLSRLTGGIGGQGPGETKLEIDRRRAKDKITRLEREIEGFTRDREVRRRRRDERNVPIIAIVGYTNAGKSTLLNRLTGAAVYAADELFATLDTTSRRLRFPEEREVVLTDTVGFIRDLPAPLVNAFRATLEELHEADVLVHVVDGQDPLRQKHIAAVMTVLEELGLLSTPRLLVLNKGEGVADDDDDAEARRLGAVRVSALTGAGLPLLVNRLADLLWQEDVVRRREPWAPAAIPAVVPGDGDGEAFGADARSYR
jgi:GTP-binding protein HflX